MTKDITELIHAVAAGKEDAMVQAGLLLALSAGHGDADLVSHFVPPPLNSRVLDESEQRELIDTLVGTLQLFPSPAAVAALGATRDEEAVAHVMDLLIRIVRDPTLVPLAEACVHALGAVEGRLAAQGATLAVEQGTGSLVSTGRRLLDHLARCSE